MDIGTDPELESFLQLAADEAAVSISDLLRQVLHLKPLTEDRRFRELCGTADNKTKALLVDLDRRLRILNPGLHYTYRTSYLGYRRETGTTEVASAERSQVFLSILPRMRRLRVVLPIDPAPYAGMPGFRITTGKGHHGVGNLQVELPDSDALGRFFETFRDWLAAPTVRALKK